MATLRQKELAKALIKNSLLGNKLDKSKILDSVGYATKTIKKRGGEVIDSVGVQKELEKAGFTLDNADNVVKEILINGKTERSRLEAADKMYKRLGGYAPEKHTVGTFSLTELLNKTKENEDTSD